MAKGTEVETPKAQLSTEDLRGLDSFEAAINLLRDELGGEIVTAEELGDGFSLLDDKDLLIGKPCMFVSWSFSAGDFGEFVTARVMVEVSSATKDRKAVYEKYIINDGGTGICVQLRDISTRKPNARMMFVPRGLRKSEYDNEFGHGTTFYIDTSAVIKK